MMEGRQIPHVHPSCQSAHDPTLLWTSTVPRANASRRDDKHLTRHGHVCTGNETTKHARGVLQLWRGGRYPTFVHYSSFTTPTENKYFFRSEVKNDLKVPEKPKLKCRGFSYSGAKLYNKLPCYIRQSTSSSSFKSHVKEWIWMNIPSY